jgi:hypothetical protein
MRVIISEIPTVFYNANQVVISDGGFGLDRPKHKDAFEQLHNVKIVLSNWGNWDQLEFPNEEAYTWFMLRWS